MHGIFGFRTCVTMTSTAEAHALPASAPGINTEISIGDDDAFSMRTSLRLTIGLVARALCQEPMK